MGDLRTRVDVEAPGYGGGNLFPPPAGYAHAATVGEDAQKRCSAGGRLLPSLAPEVGIPEQHDAGPDVCGGSDASLATGVAKVILSKLGS
jgi:hypothetical protein